MSRFIVFLEQEEIHQKALRVSINAKSQAEARKQVAASQYGHAEILYENTQLATDIICAEECQAR